MRFLAHAIFVNNKADHYAVLHKAFRRHYHIFTITSGDDELKSWRKNYVQMDYNSSEIPHRSGPEVELYIGDDDDIVSGPLDDLRVNNIDVQYPKMSKTHEVASLINYCDSYIVNHIDIFQPKVMVDLSEILKHVDKSSFVLQRAIYLLMYNDCDNKGTIIFPTSDMPLFKYILKHQNQYDWKHAKFQLGNKKIKVC